MFSHLVASGEETVKPVAVSGTFGCVNFPSAPVVVDKFVPVIRTIAPGTGSPVTESTTLPVTVAVVPPPPPPFPPPPPPPPPPQPERARKTHRLSSSAREFRKRGRSLCTRCLMKTFLQRAVVVRGGATRECGVIRAIIHGLRVTRKPFLSWHKARRR